MPQFPFDMDRKTTLLYQVSELCEVTYNDFECTAVNEVV